MNTTKRITTEEDIQHLLNIVQEYAQFNLNSKLTAIQVLEGAKDMTKQMMGNGGAE